MLRIRVSALFQLHEHSLQQVNVGLKHRTSTSSIIMSLLDCFLHLVMMCISHHITFAMAMMDSKCLAPVLFLVAGLHISQAGVP
jgi:hypothetical protein